MPGPGQLIKYPSVAPQRANVMGKALSIKTIEVRGSTMPVDHRPEVLGHGDPRGGGAVLEQENVHIPIRLGFAEIFLQRLQCGLHCEVNPERHRRGADGQPGIAQDEARYDESICWISA